MIFEMSLSPASKSVFQVFSPHIVMAQGVKGLGSASLNPLRSPYQVNQERRQRHAWFRPHIYKEPSWSVRNSLMRSRFLAPLLMTRADTCYSLGRRP